MDLDDILTKADAFDTEAAAQPGGTSLGGEGFLSQFAAIQDVKNDMEDDLSWDDIIPVEERVKMDEEESRILQAQETASANRTRAAARPPGTYEGMDLDDGEGEGKSSKAGSPSQKGNGKSKKPAAGGGAPRKSNAQKALELKGTSRVTSSRTLASRECADITERDLRVLIRGIQKWGDVRQRYDVIVSVLHVQYELALIQLGS